MPTTVKHSRPKGGATVAPGKKTVKPGRPKRRAGAGNHASKRRATEAARVHRRGKEALPGWGDLDATRKRSKAGEQGGVFLSRLSTARFVFCLGVIVIAFTAYVGHVHATQELLAELQQARRDNLRLHLRYNRLKGEYDQATGPRVVYERARALGLEEDFSYGPTIHVEE